MKHSIFILPLVLLSLLATAKDTGVQFLEDSPPGTVLTLPTAEAQAFTGEIALPVDFTMAKPVSDVFLHAPLTVSVKETTPAAATFSESLVFRSYADKKKNTTDNNLHLNRPANTAFTERRNGPTHDFTQFPEEYRNSRYRRG